MQSGHKIYLHASLGAPRAHHSLFVETNAQTGTGHLYHVTGNIQSGMVYAPRPELHPLASPEFQRRKLLGYVPESEYHRVDEICRSVEPPAKQFDGARPLVPRDRTYQAPSTSVALGGIKAMKTLWQGKPGLSRAAR